MINRENQNDVEISTASAEPFHQTEKQVTRRTRKHHGHILRNPKLSQKQRLLILQERYPEAPEKLLEAASNYRTPHDFSKAIHEVEPIKSGETSLVNTSKQLNDILMGKLSGWNHQREPNRIIQASANWVGWPVDDFVPVLGDGDRLDNLRRHYPKANDALLQVIVPFKICLNFTKQLLEVGPLKSSGITLRNGNVRLYNILTRRHESDLKRKKEADGTSPPNDVILAVAAFTGLDYRYFLHLEDGGISLKRGQRITYHEETGKYSIVSATPKATRRFAAPIA